MNFTFPINFVYWKQVPNHKQIKDYLLPIIKEKKPETESIRPSGWECKINTSFSKDLDFNSFLFEDDIVKQIVWESVDSMFEELKSLNVPNSSIVKESWYNIYTEDSQDQYQEIHHHLADHPEIYNDIEYFPSYSLIYVLESQTEKNPTVFFSPGPHTGRSATGDIYFDTSKHDTIGEGTVIIFPSHLKHYVKPTKQNRITLSYNICSEF